MRRHTGSEQLIQEKDIGPALQTRQSHTIEYAVTKIVPQRYCIMSKSKKSCGPASHAVLRRFCSEEAHKCTDVRQNAPNIRDMCEVDLACARVST